MKIFEGAGPMALRVTIWAEMQARQVLEKGRSLTDVEFELALRAGVLYPEEILVLDVPSMPISEEVDLMQALVEASIVTPTSKGLTIGYCIFLLENGCPAAQLAHQLAQVAQFENCGGIPAFFERYLAEVRVHGCPAAPLKVQAAAFAAREFPPQALRAS